MVTREQKLPGTLWPEIRKRMIQIVLLLIFEGILLLVAAGRLDWLWAWVYLGLYIAGVAVNAYFMFRIHPETIARRASGEGAKGWDKIISGLWAAMGIVQLVVAGLDERSGWSGALSLNVHSIGIAGFVLGFGLFSWAMITNSFFSTVVRVQADSGHTVCTTGPYHFVRHPGYLGAILQTFALPLLLGSLWALIFSVLSAVCMIARTGLEDQTLQAELTGYREYAQHIHYRLLPGVW